MPEWRSSLMDLVCLPCGAKIVKKAELEDDWGGLMKKKSKSKGGAGPTPAAPKSVTLKHSPMDMTLIRLHWRREAARKLTIAAAAASASASASASAGATAGYGGLLDVEPKRPKAFFSDETVASHLPSNFLAHNPTFYASNAPTLSVAYGCAPPPRRRRRRRRCRRTCRPAYSVLCWLLGFHRRLRGGAAARSAGLVYGASARVLGDLRRNHSDALRRGGVG
jgi:hypothetical protein